MSTDSLRAPQLAADAEPALPAGLSQTLCEDGPVGQWVPDYLPGCRRRTLILDDDDEGPVTATIIRYESMADSATQAPMLSLHGWTDYFYNLPMAHRFASAGHRFYALDLRKYGRSLRDWQSPGHIEDLAEYDAEINAALQVIAEENPHSPAPILLGHSTGGLISALYAHRHPEKVGALILNSPWLEMPGDVVTRYAAEGLISPVSAVKPTATLKLPRVNNYWSSLSATAHGEWQLHPLWRPQESFPITAGWLKAVLSGHQEVHSGLQIQCPVLVLLSAHTVYRKTWTPEYLENDGVLDVEVLARRAVKLGRQVTVIRLPAAMHDVFASRLEVRTAAFKDARRWLSVYSPSGIEAG